MGKKKASKQNDYREGSPFRLEHDISLLQVVYDFRFHLIPVGSRIKNMTDNIIPFLMKEPIWLAQETMPTAHSLVCRFRRLLRDYELIGLNTCGDYAKERLASLLKNISNDISHEEKGTFDESPDSNTRAIGFHDDPQPHHPSNLLEMQIKRRRYVNHQGPEDDDDDITVVEPPSKFPRRDESSSDPERGSIHVQNRRYGIECGGSTNVFREGDHITNGVVAFPRETPHLREHEAFLRERIYIRECEREYEGERRRECEREYDDDRGRERERERKRERKRERERKYGSERRRDHELDERDERDEHDERVERDERDECGERDERDDRDGRDECDERDEHDEGDKCDERGLVRAREFERQRIGFRQWERSRDDYHSLRYERAMSEISHIKTSARQREDKLESRLYRLEEKLHLSESTRLKAEKELRTAVMEDRTAKQHARYLLIRELQKSQELIAKNQDLIVKHHDLIAKSQDCLKNIARGLGN